MSRSSISMANFFLLGLLFAIRGSGAADSDSIDFAAYGEDKLSNVVVVGNVLCEACSGSSTHVIAGAMVGLECKTNIKRKSTSLLVEVAESDEYGEFKMEVPSAFHPEERVNKCSVRVVWSPESSCNVASATKPSNLALLSNDLNGLRTYITTPALTYRSRFCYI